MLCSPALSLGVPIYRDLRQAPMIQSVSPPHPHRHASNRGGAVSAAARSAFTYSAVVRARGSAAPCNLRRADSPPTHDSCRAGRLRPSWDWRAARWCLCPKQLAGQFPAPSPLLLDRSEHEDARPGVAMPKSNGASSAGLRPTNDRKGGHQHALGQLMANASIALIATVRRADLHSRLRLKRVQVAPAPQERAAES